MLNNFILSFGLSLLLLLVIFFVAYSYRQSQKLNPNISTISLPKNPDNGTLSITISPDSVTKAKPQKISVTAFPSPTLETSEGKLVGWVSGSLIQRVIQRNDCWVSLRSNATCYNGRNLRNAVAPQPTSKSFVSQSGIMGVNVC